MGSPQANLELSSCQKLKHIHPERLHKDKSFKMWTHIKGNTFTFLFIFGCFVAFTLAATSEEAEIIEDILKIENESSEDILKTENDSSEDMSSSESVRSARFLRWPKPSKKIKLRKRLGHPSPQNLDPMKPKKRLHVKTPLFMAKRPMRANPMVYKKVARKGPLGVKLPPRGPEPSPQRGLKRGPIPIPQRGHKTPRKLPMPVPPKNLKAPKAPPRAIYKKQLKHKNLVPKKTQNKKVVPALGLEKPVINEVVNKKIVPKPAGPLATKQHQKKQGLLADERFFFPTRPKRRPRPSKKRPKKRPSKYRRPKPQPKPKPQAVYKPKPTKKPARYPKTTTKAAPVYKPAPTGYPDVEITSYKPPQNVYNPSSDVDNFPAFSKPNFPDLSGPSPTGYPKAEVTSYSPPKDVYNPSS